MTQREHFATLADALCSAVRPGEVVLLSYYGEASDFVRFNHARVRQAGHVEQRELRIELVHGARHAAVDLTLQGTGDHDRELALRELEALRELLPLLPEDPYLNYASETQDSLAEHAAATGSPREWLAVLGDAAGHLDLVGILALGPQYHGFANSLGQRNWQRAASFHFDWSVYDARGRAVKARYAGSDWDAETLAARVADAAHRLTLLDREPRNPGTGRQRAYLAPAALAELLQMLAWGGFSIKALRTGQSPLQRLADGREQLHHDIALAADRACGTGPGFSAAGFVVPARVELLHGGRFGEALCGARSAREFGLPVNARGEYPEALDLAAGALPGAAVLEAVGDGLYVSDLWYCNYADRNHCRVTGMTRYASFTVRDGALDAPLPAMRFDDSLYELLGARLVGLTREREQLADTGTYARRASGGQRLPGLVVDGLNLTL
jgi:predicted Zn-dependent protease